MSPIIVGPPPEGDPASAELLSVDLRNGEAERFTIRLATIKVQGTSVSLPSPGVTAIIGGNNAGKSTLLSQMNQFLASHSGTGAPTMQPKLLDSIGIASTGNPADLAAWLSENAYLHLTEGQSDPVFHRAGAGSLTTQLLKLYWKTGMAQLGPVAPQLVHYADARSRWKWTQGVERRPKFDDPPSHPMHVFEFDGARAQQISDLCQEAFGAPLTIDRLSRETFFRVGTVDTPSPRIDAPTGEYAAELSTLPLLSQQGDGMVSMLGGLIPIVASTFPIILIDEPEAFLHPPQAFLMGRAIAHLSVIHGLQVVLATHDRNVLRGLLAEDDSEVSIVRLARSGPDVDCKQLDTQRVGAIANDPVLRHTAILEGLFHTTVVLVENERDCKFYQAVLEELPDAATPPHEVFFFPTHGKGGMAKIAAILRDTGVKVVSSPDFDIFEDAGSIKGLFEAHGGDWAGEQMASLRDRAMSGLKSSRTPLLNKDVLAQVKSILGDRPEEPFGNEVSGRVRGAIKTPNPFAALKERGTSSLRADRAARDDLLSRLQARGIFPVPVGELEGFCPDASRSSKDRWLQDALENGAHRGESARDHVRSLLA